MKTAAVLAKAVRRGDAGPPPPSPFRRYGQMLTEELVDSLRAMETVDPFNRELRRYAEDLVKAFDAVAAAYDDVYDRMVGIRGVMPERYAHLYVRGDH